MPDDPRPPSTPGDASASSNDPGARAASWLAARLDAAEADEAYIEALTDGEVRAALDEVPGDADAEAALRARLDGLRAAATAPSAQESDTPPQSVGRPPPRPVDRLPVASSPRRRWPWVRTALMVLAVAYAGLWVFSTATVPTSLNLASLEAVPQDSVAQALPDDVAASVARLRTAQKTRLGLFPRYDVEVVEASETELRAAFEAVRDRPRGPEPTARQTQRALAAYLLGKTALMRDDEAEARRWLQQAASEDGTSWALPAENLLAQLDA
ncbi:MAG: hypothetical protein AAGF99_11065 [Bacteroidota bacterium]